MVSHQGRADRLVPVRVGRMIASPYGFLRGTAVVMAEDVARLPSTGITPVVCGDSHLGNFGFYASPERDLVHRLRNEASLAALCGVAPVPASSGKITPHRLSRGGDRAANNALYPSTRNGRTKEIHIDDYCDLRPARQAKDITLANRRHSFRRPTDHRLPARTRTPTQRHPGQQLPPMAHRRLTS